MDTSLNLLLIAIILILLILYIQNINKLSANKLKVEHLNIYSQSLNKTIANLQEQDKAFHDTIYSLKEDSRKSYSTIPNMVDQHVNEFKQNEISRLREVIEISAKQAAMADLETWKIQFEAYYRQDAINRSQAVIMGKITEHLIPFHESFPFNPKEARFIGSPIDIIVFDGINTEDIVDIYILEIKTGNSALNKRQKLIKNAVLNNRVHWREIRI